MNRFSRVGGIRQEKIEKLIYFIFDSDEILYSQKLRSSRITITFGNFGITIQVSQTFFFGLHLRARKEKQE